jgi:two-component system, LytTR family, response regulator
MKLCISSLKGFQVIHLSDILYCEAVSSYTIFHMMNGQQITASRSIIEYELMLEDNFFCRVHKSNIINLTHVVEYKKGEGGTVLLTNGKEVEVSRRKKEIFLARMKEFFKM